MLYTQEHTCGPGSGSWSAIYLAWQQQHGTGGSNNVRWIWAGDRPAMASVKVGELRSVLENFANSLEANKADWAAVQRLRDLCAMFAGSESKAVPAFLKAAERVASSTHEAKGPLLADVAPVLLSLRSLVDDIAKKDLNNSLDSLLDVVRAHADSPISVFATNIVSAGAVSSSKPKG